jgi:hypothetical protein
VRLMSNSATIAVDETSAPFLGQWNRLVSTTNWEKGRIILQWRQALLAAGGPAAEYSDEAWSLRVGNVTGQHVGRLRRVYERFDALRAELTALYWSHFQAALDWEDAEMWLEGAEQSGWSVAEMRRQRWETLGAIETDRPPMEDVAGQPLDEDSDAADSDITSSTAIGHQLTSRRTQGLADGNGDERSQGSTRSADGLSEDAAPDDDQPEESDSNSPGPFAHLAEMPDDMGEAFEALKLSIIRHKFAGWQQISRDDVLTAVDALRELALAPAE